MPPEGEFQSIGMLTVQFRIGSLRDPRGPVLISHLSAMTERDYIIVGEGPGLEAFKSIQLLSGASSN